jgi:serine/threonine protein kinase
MELCDVTLEDFILEHNFKSTTPITIAEVWNIMTQITNGLVYIHTQNEVHRDLKPSNSTYMVGLN